MAEKFRWIGLTGGIASGKSTVAQLFEGRGLPVIDADKIAKDVVKKGTSGLQEIVRAFGPGVLDTNQELDRKKMGSLVFANKEHLDRLESIIHPLVQSEVQLRREYFKAKGHSAVIYDVPLLFEKNLHKQFDGIVLIWCDPAIQLQRLIERDQLSPAEATNRLKAQLPLEDKKKRSSWCIENNGDMKSLKVNFEKVFQEIQSGKVNPN
jgi:dephospho-CoA kinase